MTPFWKPTSKVSEVQWSDFLPLALAGEEKRYETSHEVFRGILVKQMMAITMKDGEDGVMRLLMIACFVNTPLI